MPDWSDIYNQPRIEDIPTKHETFEAQVLVITQPRKETVYPFNLSIVSPMREASRVIQAGKYRLELVPSELMHGKPTLIIYEEATPVKGEQS